jgi:hypothetical protein
MLPSTFPLYRFPYHLPFVDPSSSLLSYVYGQKVLRGSVESDAVHATNAPGRIARVYLCVMFLYSRVVLLCAQNSLMGVSDLGGYYDAAIYPGS